MPGADTEITDQETEQLLVAEKHYQKGQDLVIGSDVKALVS